MKKILVRSLVALLIISNLSVLVQGQNPAPSQSFNAWLNERIQSIISARLDLREKTRQTETPSVSQNTTSLVDQSSASSLIGVGLNLAGLTATSNDPNEANSVSVTATAYSLYAAAKGVNPLNPGFYNRNAAWRNFSVTLGYDDEKSTDGSNATNRTKIIGFKWLIINGREPGKHPQQLEIIRQNLERAAGTFGRLGDKITFYMFKQPNVTTNLVAPGFAAFLQVERQRQAVQTSQQARDAVARIDALLGQNVANLFAPGADRLPPNVPPNSPGGWTIEEASYYVAFQNQYLSAAGFQQLLAVIGQEEVDKIEQMIEQEIDPFLTLHKVSSEAIEAIRKAPQFSVSFLTKQRGAQPDEYMAEAIFDWGIVNRINLTANGAFEYQDSKIIGGDTRGARFAAQLEFQLTPENKLAGRKPFNFYLATDSKKLEGMDWIYRAQSKINIPIADGIEFPISVTFANRTELINEKDVRGQFGFTVDLARLVKAFSSK